MANAIKLRYLRTCKAGHCQTLIVFAFESPFDEQNYTLQVAWLTAFSTSLIVTLSRLLISHGARPLDWRLLNRALQLPIEVLFSAYLSLQLPPLQVQRKKSTHNILSNSGIPCSSRTPQFHTKQSPHDNPAHNIPPRRFTTTIANNHHGRPSRQRRPSPALRRQETRARYQEATIRLTQRKRKRECLRRSPAQA
jgi:hypothetical protein